MEFDKVCYNCKKVMAIHDPHDLKKCLIELSELIQQLRNVLGTTYETLESMDGKWK